MKHFNRIVAENAIKPIYIYPSEDTYYLAEADKIVAFAKANMMALRYHTHHWHE